MTHWLAAASDSTARNLLKMRNSSRGRVRVNVLNHLSLEHNNVISAAGETSAPPPLRCSCMLCGD